MTRRVAWLLLSLSLVLGTAVAAAADTANMAGSWTFKIVVPQGTRTPHLVLAQVGETLSGSYKGQRGDGSVAGKVTGNSFVISTEITTADASLTVEYRGTVSGDSVAGTVHMGRLGEAAFTGTRAR